MSFFGHLKKKKKISRAGVQTDYKLVSEAGGGDQRSGNGGHLYYSSSRGLFLDAATLAERATSVNAATNVGAAVAAAATVSSPPRVRCAATGAWKRARPITDDGGKSGS